MHTTAAPHAAPFTKPHDNVIVAAAAAPGMGVGGGQRIADRLRLLEAVLSPTRRIVHAGDVIYRSGEAFSHLYVLNSGFFKLISVSAEGREQVVGLKFRGDWLGFGAISRNAYACDAVAMDTAEVWAVRYDELLRACAKHPALLEIVHEAMSSQIMRDRDSVTSICTLPADARVVAFLHYWGDALAVRGLRADQFSLRLTRAEIGNYLGLTLETVSRVLSKLVRERLIAFNERSRRNICIPDFPALQA
ncbi:MAG: Crp/Fnr family transcriptional regulator, partial [Roseateles sp.]